MESYARVALLEKSVIVPVTPTKKGHMFLPSLDIFWQDIHYNRRVMFYKTGFQDLSNAIDILKTSLSHALVPYYPWAGRVALGEDRRLVIDCNDEEVEFVEASVDVPLSSLEQDGFQMKAFFDDLCQHVEHRGESLYTSPLLSVQATRFADGGLAVAVAQSHVVADGQALWNFMVAWGETARGVELSTEPVHDRRRLELKNPSEEKAKLGFEEMLAGAEEDATTETSPEKTTEQHSVAGEADDPLVQALFVISSASIQHLKRLAGTPPRSSYEVLCSHFWRHVCLARQPPPSQPALFAILANCRSRLSPPLPPSYFGNVIMFALGFSRTVHTLLAEPLADTASRIHAAIGECTERNLLAFMHWLELHDNRMAQDFKPRGSIMNVASSPRFPAYEVDYGWGRPAAVRSAKVEGDGEMVLFGGRAEAPGDVEVCMCLASSALQRLRQDPEFLAMYPQSS